LLALNDFQSMIQTCLRRISKKKHERYDRILELGKRKLHFLMSWINEVDNDKEISMQGYAEIARLEELMTHPQESSGDIAAWPVEGT